MLNIANHKCKIISFHNYLLLGLFLRFLLRLFAYGVEPPRFFLGAHTILCKYSSATVDRMANGI